MKIKIWIGIVMIIFCMTFEQNADSKDITVEAKYPDLAVGVLKSAVLTSMQEGILLAADGITIKESEIKLIVDKYEANIRSQMEKNLFFILEQEITKRLLLKEANIFPVNIDEKNEQQIIKSHLNKIAGEVKVTDADLKDFYDQNKELLGNTSFEQAKESIYGFLIQNKKQTIINAYISHLGDKKNIRINSDWAKTQDKIVKDNPVDKARISGKNSMIEFGAKGCVPCDMMQPILTNLRTKYKDKLNVIFVNVREDQMLGARFSIKSIPVQAFFDKNGKEVFRHEGFYAEAEIIKQLIKMGLK